LSDQAGDPQYVPPFQAPNLHHTGEATDQSNLLHSGGDRPARPDQAAAQRRVFAGDAQLTVQRIAPLRHLDAKLLPFIAGRAPVVVLILASGSLQTLVR